MSVLAEDIQAHWSVVGPLFSIRNEHEYDLAIERLNALMDDVGTDEEHPLYELLDTLGAVIHAYEEKHYPMPECSGVDMLRFLMEEHGLTPSDFVDLGTADVVSEILDGKRELTVKHLHILSARFHVSPVVFV